jgi:hypothetical protein
MSDLNRLRELAALLQPKREITYEGSGSKSLSAIESEFATMMNNIHGMFDRGGRLEKALNAVKHLDKDMALVADLQAATEQYQKKVMKLLDEAEIMLHEGTDPEPVLEMASAASFRGGCFNRKNTKLMIRQFRAGEETFDLPTGEKFTAHKLSNAASLKKGDVVFASHDKYNTGAELYQVLGFGKGDNAKYDTLKAAYAATGTSTLKALEDWNGDNEKDEVRLIVKDLADGDSGDFFYISGGRFCYGSGAEPLTFTSVTQTGKAEVKEAKNHMDESEYQSVASWKRALKAKLGDKVWYDAHEGTIDAFTGTKPYKKGETQQVGHWDDTTGTVY